MHIGPLTPLQNHNMMEASGKGNCMFASKNTLKYLLRLIPLSTLLCVSYSQAQQPAPARDSTDSRRIERLGEGSTDEWEMDLRLPGLAPAVKLGNSEFALPDEEQNRKLQELLAKLAENPGDPGLLAQLNIILEEVLAEINDLLDAGSIEQAEQLFPLIQTMNPDFEGFNAAKFRLKTIDETNELLNQAEAALLSGQLLEPENSSAMYYYSRALEKDPQSEAAQKGLERIQQALIEWALESARELDFETTELWLLEASAVRPKPMNYSIRPRQHCYPVSFWNRKIAALCIITTALWRRTRKASRHKRAWRGYNRR